MKKKMHSSVTSEISIVLELQHPNVSANAKSE